MLYGNTAMSDSAWASLRASFPPSHKVHPVEISNTSKGRDQCKASSLHEDESLNYCITMYSALVSNGCQS